MIHHPTLRQLPFALLSLLSFWFILAFLFIALASINYPYHLEWMEGQSIDVVARVAAGLPIYVEPTIEYVPFIYTPFYYYVSAIFSKTLGVDFFAARLVSLLSIIGVGITLYHWICKEGNPRGVALLGVGLFFSTYELSSRWFDVARLDSLFLLLIFLGLYGLRFYSSYRTSIITGLLFTAAFYTKQPALLIAIFAFIGTFFINKTHAIRTATTFACATFIGFLYFQFESEGWFGFYTLTLPANHTVDKKFYLDFWVKDMWKNLWPLMLISIYGWVDLLSRDRQKACWYFAFAVGCMAVAYSGRLHRYGWTNVLIPAHAMLALCAALSIGQWIQHEYKRKITLATLLCLIQMLLLLYNPVENIPTKENRAQGDAFLKRIAEIEGDVFIPEIQFVQTRVGKKSYSYGMAAVDIIVSDLPHHHDMKEKFKNELKEAIEAKRFGAVIPPLLIPTYGIRNFEPYYGGYYGYAETIHYPRNHLSGHIFKQEMQLLLPIDKPLPLNKYTPN